MGALLGGRVLSGRCRHSSDILVRLFLLTAFSMALTCASLLRLEDNQYKGIVVAISERVQQEQGEQIITSIKKMFEDASPVLHKATLKRASFGDVTILIPKSWQKPGAEAASYETFTDAQIRVDSANPVYGDAPYTQQSKGCGEQGDFIHFSPEYLIDLNHSEQRYGSPAKVLVHEWAHYRYGIFDEYGYPGDPIYPHIYGDKDGNPRHTGCSDSPIKGTFSDQCQLDDSTGQYSKECRFTPDKTQSHIFSSLMYMHFLPQVEFFCNDQNLQHNKEAPTKQNAFCNSRSTWDVISHHQDFNDSTTSETVATPKFKIVQPDAPRFFLLWDISAGMKQNDRFLFTETAIKEFMSHFLPAGSLMGFRAFDDQLRDSAEMSDNLETIKQKFPRTTTSNFAKWNTVLLALEESRNQLLRYKGGVIILISAGFDVPPSDNGQGFKDACESLQLQGIKVVSVLYPFQQASSDSADYHLSTLAEKTNGRNFFIYEHSIGSITRSWVLSQLTSALATVGQMDNGDSGNSYVLVEDNRLYNGTHISGTVMLDAALGKKFTIILSAKNIQNVDKYSIKITNPLGEESDYNKMNSADRSFSFTNYRVQSGEWKFHVEMSALPAISGEPSIAVTALAYPLDNHEPIKINSWTNVGNKPTDPKETPVVIYAEVKKGSHPVQNARVIAKIARPRPFSGSYTTIEMELLDNGNGDPDLIKGDGIYSRYFTDFGDKAVGHYLLSIFVDDNNGAAVITGQLGYSGVLPVNPTELSYCCGSSTGVHKGSVPTLSFTRSMNAGTFNTISELPAGDAMPPGKVMDLQIKMSKPGQQSVVLMWTAPGDNYDSGTATRYDIKVATKRADILDNFDNLDSASDIPRPLSGGQIQEFEVIHSLIPDKRIVFYALRAVDSSGNKGRISNIVRVEFPALPSTSTLFPGVTPPTQPSPANENKLSSAEIGIILGCVLGLLLIILILIIFIILHRRRQKARNASSSSGNAPYPFKAPLDSTVTENGKHNLLPHHPPPEKPPKTNHVGSNGNVFTVETPQFMTASELLERHEQHKRSNKDGGSIMDEDDIEKPRPPSDSYYISHHYNDDLQPPPNYTHGYNGPNNSFERTSFSDKPSSSFTSLSTNEHRRDNGYFTSYEETSEDSGIVKHPSGGALPPPGPLTSSKTSLSSQRRVVSESQV